MGVDWPKNLSGLRVGTSDKLVLDGVEDLLTGDESQSMLGCCLSGLRGATEPNMVLDAGVVWSNIDWDEHKRQATAHEDNGFEGPKGYAT